MEAAVPACNDADCDTLLMEPSNAVSLLATIRERQGRVEDAITLLHTREVTSVNGRDHLADLLARHDLITELRAYAASEYHGHAVQRLAEVLEERGDVEAAIAVYLIFDATPSCLRQVAVQLSELLVRHGRSNEAVEVLRAHRTRRGGLARPHSLHPVRRRRPVPRGPGPPRYHQGTKRRQGVLGPLPNAASTHGRLRPPRRSDRAGAGAPRG